MQYFDASQALRELSSVVRASLQLWIPVGLKVFPKLSIVWCIVCSFSHDKVERADDVLYIIKRRLLQVIQLHASSDFTTDGQWELMKPLCVFSVPTIVER